MCTEDRYGKSNTHFINLHIYIESKKKHRTQALKRYLLIDPPKTLIVNLKRFQHSGGFSFSKNSKRVSFPLILQLDEYMIHQVRKDDGDTIKEYSEARDDKEWVSKYQYRLYGVVCHSGSMGGGHYIAFTCYEYQGQRYWLYISDSFVERVDEARVLACEAYILFYQSIP